MRQRDELERRIIRLAVPALGTLAVEPIYVLVDTAIVGRLGTPQLAGMAIASIVLMNVVSIINFLEYVTPDIAFAVGAGRRDDAQRVAAHGVWLSVFIGVPVAALVAVVARPLCWLIGGRGEVLHHAVTYLTISAIGLPFVVLAFLGHGVLRGYNDLRTPLRIVVAANVANLVFEIVTVYGLHWGVAGSAASTVVVQVGAACAFLWKMRQHLVSVRPSWVAYRPLVQAGWHMVVRSVAMYSVWNVSVVIAARLDAPTLAAYQVVTQVFMFLALLLDSLAVDGEGNVCVATLVNGGITVISPTDGSTSHIATGDLLTTNICFGDNDGSGEYRDAYITCSGTGRLLHMRWPHKGLRLNYL